MPLIALAPLVVSWGGKLHIGGFEWPRWLSAAVLGAFLAFFPVAVGTLKGLTSAPQAASLELMDSYAASWRQTLFKLRFPAAVPFMIPALKLAATASVIGVVVAEISTGLAGGVGRLIIEYAREATSDPAKVFTAVFAAAGLGLLMAGLVAVIDLVSMRNRPPKEAVRVTDRRRARSGPSRRRSTPGTANAVDALVDIDLTIRPGEFVSLIGPSGCGKSTQLRLIANLLEPTTGEVLVNGKPARQARLDQDYGMAFQHAGLFEWRTVAKNVELPLELKDWGKEERRQRAEEMLGLVKLPEFAEHYPWQLSGGMQQRVAIARALAAHPPLLLMDEPFGALDEMTREHMQAELLRICGETGTTVVFVTHSIAEAVYLSTRVVVMSPRPGKIKTVIEVDLGAKRSIDTREDPASSARSPRCGRRSAGCR